MPFRVGSAAHVEPEFVGGLEASYYKETASQTYKVGDLVYTTTAGTVSVCTTSTGKLDGLVLGQANKAATGVTGASVHLSVIRPSDKFIMNVYHGTVGLAVTAITQLHAVFGVIQIPTTFGTTSKWHVDIENTPEASSSALGCVRVVGFPSKGPNGADNTIPIVGTTGDTYGFVYVQFLPFTIATSGTFAFRRILQYQ